MLLIQMLDNFVEELFEKSHGNFIPFKIKKKELCGSLVVAILYKAWPNV